MAGLCLRGTRVAYDVHVMCMAYTTAYVVRPSSREILTQASWAYVPCMLLSAVIAIPVVLVLLFVVVLLVARPPAAHCRGGAWAACDQQPLRDCGCRRGRASRRPTLVRDINARSTGRMGRNPPHGWGGWRLDPLRGLDSVQSLASWRGRASPSPEPRLPLSAATG